VLTDQEAWKNLPPAEEGGGQPLPAWIRALAVSLPKTAAAMLDLDYAQRMERALPLQLRAKLRFVAAKANRCVYAQAYACADYVRAGGKAEDIDDLANRITKLPEKERLALEFVRQLTEAAYTVTDQQVARLVELYDEQQVVAMVLVAAYANFQDRLLLALGVAVEPEGPLPPIKVRFRKPPAAPKPENGSTADIGKEGSKRKLSPPAQNPPAIPEKVDDPEWTAISFENLRQRLGQQIGRREARVRIPDSKTVLSNLPDTVPPLDAHEMDIRWCRLTYGYQPKLTAAWLGGLDVFDKESDLDFLFHESMFWVVTRSLQCFY
jgi:alkylhydroperoxidase family enzyme